MKNKLHFMLVMTGLMFLCSCQSSTSDYQQEPVDPLRYHRTVKRLTDVMVHDVFSPPVASRNYVYPAIAAYEVLVNGDTGFVSLAGQLTGLDQPPKPLPDKTYLLPLSAIKAHLTVAKTLIFSVNMLDEFEQQIIEEFKADGVPDDILERSLAYGNEVGNHIIAWAGKDNYKETRTFPLYTIEDEKERWKPTPPDFMPGIEPHWNKIRPFIIDSATQFIPVRPTAFDVSNGSPFYKEIEEVYEIGKNLSQEQTEIAQFWDCNPYVSHHKGHAMFATKKITPGGHWIGITSISTKMSGCDFMHTVEAYAKASITIADAFISCWDEKYRSLLVRPETLINEMMDEDWKPLLQTPPFPEYTSGHSVVSGASATMLTSIFGDNFAFNDTTEVEYGLTARKFNSFLDAADEAAISRLYGGIHYMPAINNGVDQGKKVGNYIVSHLKTRK